MKLFVVSTIKQWICFCILYKCEMCSNILSNGAYGSLQNQLTDRLILLLQLNCPAKITFSYKLNFPDALIKISILRHLFDASGNSVQHFPHCGKTYVSFTGSFHLRNSIQMKHRHSCISSKGTLWMGHIPCLSLSQVS